MVRQVKLTVLFLLLLVSAARGDRLPCAAVLLMGSEAESLAAEEVLYQMGVPHYVSRSPDRCAQAALVIVSFGQIEKTPKGFASWLRCYVDNGGIVLAQKPRDMTLAAIFGYEKAIASKARHEIIWTSVETPLKRYVDSPEENTIRLGSYSHDELFWTVGYESKDAQVIANFEDGKAALMEKKYPGGGRAIALGASLVDLVIRSYLDRDFGVQKVGSNSFEPSTDMTLLLIKAIYQEYVPYGLTIRTMPPGKKGALIITHDIDAWSSFENVEEFANVAKRYGVRSTIFLLTKYVDDYYDRSFMTVENLSKIRKLAEQGFEIGSHSVSHTPQFPSLPLGQIVKDPDYYRPRIKNMSETVNATLRGEVWVSKSIIASNAMPPPRSFRSGHLLFNNYLPNVLEEAGYLYDSSMGVYHCACNFPFRQFKTRSFHTQSKIIEIPMTISDYDWLEDMTRLLPNFKQIIVKNSANGAPVTLLIHPTRKSDKLETLEMLLRWLPDDFWAGTVESFGQFWRSRYHLNPAVSFDGEAYVYEFSPDRRTEAVELELNRKGETVIASTMTHVNGDDTITLPALAKGSHVAISIRKGKDSGTSGTTGNLENGADPLEQRISLSSGLQSYDDYGRTGTVPVFHGSFWIRKYQPSVWGLKFWDYFSWRTGEAGEATNEGGFTFDRNISGRIVTWVRLINHTYTRKFPQSVLKMNEPRLELTLKLRTERISYLLESSMRTAFYSSPDSITEKRYVDVRVSPRMTYRLSPRLSIGLNAVIHRRSYRRQKLYDIYATDFYGYSTGMDLGVRGESSQLGISSRWMLRRYSGDKDRGSVWVGLTFRRKITSHLDFESRMDYIDAQFTESEYDRFFWGEALTSYSMRLALTFSYWNDVAIRLGSSYRIEDYKQNPFIMRYLTLSLGFSTSLSVLNQSR